ncbi:MAG: crotonobetainyl-CoA:carnitine CoA-transferase CaiB-like acyl-CoA transferase [Acidimicrobiales bacterium]
MPSGGSGLAGIRVLEIGSGVGPAWVGKLFADLDADVVRFETPDDLVRNRPHDIHRWLNANKRSVTDGLWDFVADADIVIHGLTPSQAAVAGLTYDELAAAGKPSLVVTSLTPYGATGPYADFAAEELNMIHASSWGFVSPSSASDPKLPPLKAPGHHASIMVANGAAAATLAAFDQADRTGSGRFVDFSGMAAGAKMTETAPAIASFMNIDPSRLGVKTLLPWGIYACADGMIQILCVEEAQWAALRNLMGNPEWAEMEIFATNEDRQDNVDLLDLYLGEWLTTQKVDELYEAAQAARIPFTPVNSMPQIADNPQFAARGFFATTPDGLEVPGAGFKNDQSWWALRTSAPQLGEHNGEGWKPGPAPTGSKLPVAAPPADSAASAQEARPLEGVRVCDFTWVWAGPFCTQYLAHLGADVIRLESPDRLCLFRRLPISPIGMPVEANTAGMFQHYNTDKRSVGIDLHHPDALDVVKKLIACSDVVIDNFGVGVMASLGLGVDDVRAINPDIIVTSLTGFGQTGPSASYMAYGPAGGAFSGLYSANGYADGPPLETGVAVGDPCTGLTALWGVVASLVARRRTGAVARIDVAMVEGMASSIGELWMEYLATGESPMPQGNRDAVWAPHNCYPSAGEDQWLTIACTTQEAWVAAANVIDPALLSDPRFETMALRKTNEDDLDDIISQWTSAGDRWDRCRALQAAGVASIPSLSPIDLWRGNEHMEALDMLARPEHPVTGNHVVAGVPWKLSPGPNGLRRPAPLLGQHNLEVLTELLGYSAEEVDRLQHNGALK